MTAKKDCVNLDAYACILHAAEMGIPFESYMAKVCDYGKKRIRMISKGMEEE